MLAQSVYCASKYFVEALSEGTRREVRLVCLRRFDVVQTSHAACACLWDRDGALLRTACWYGHPCD
eukprot:COSAG02_NODE_52632_length_306_cov_1.256039_1_plen_65_part_10